MTKEPSDDPGFSDREMRLIFERAGQLGADTPRDGRFSLAELQDMGAQAGLDPRDVARAAALVRGVPPARPLLGAPTRFEWTFSIDRRLSESGLADVVAKVRSAAKLHGELRMVPGGVEWRARSPLAGYIADFSPKRDGTRVNLVVAAADDAVLSGLLGSGIGATVGIISAFEVGLQLHGSVGVALAVGAAAAVATGWAAARLLWMRAASRWRARGESIRQVIADAVEESAE